MSLRSLSDTTILSRIHKLTRCERGVTLRVLQHLNEIERRKLHLKLGYSSMFDYCTSGLGYSASAAWRRIQSARCMASFPEVYDLLKANDVNLTTIAEVSRVLTVSNKDALLARMRGGTQAHVKAIVAEYETRPMPRDVIEPMVIRKVTPASDGTLRLAAAACPGSAVSAALPEPLHACEKGDYCRSGSTSPSSAEAPASEVGTSEVVTIENCFKVSFAAGEAFMGKFRRIKSLACHRLPAKPTVEQVLELAMDAFIASEDPAARQARREKRRKRVETRSRHPRHVAAAVRDQVFVRDRGSCSYVGAHGRVCGSTHGLQLDHIVPVARGGRGTVSNLRLLCAQHNRVEAERLGLPQGAGARRGTLP
jgi:5-methylcytosine-specific restriction endonuclease McrA